MKPSSSAGGGGGPADCGWAIGGGCAGEAGLLAAEQEVAEPDRLLAVCEAALNWAIKAGAAASALWPGTVPTGNLECDGADSRGRNFCGSLIAVQAEVDILACAGVDGAEIGPIQFLGANNVRHDDEDNLVVLDGMVFGAEDVFEDGNGAEAGNSGRVLLLLVVLDAAEDAGFSFAETDDLVTTRCERIGSVTPLMVTDPLCEVTSILIFNVTSWSKWTVGVISILTPTSWYWNCVLTSELTTAVAAPFDRSR